MEKMKYISPRMKVLELRAIGSLLIDSNQIAVDINSTGIQSEAEAKGFSSGADRKSVWDE